MIKLLIVDDEPIIREGIARMIPCEALGIRLTASCANAFEALDSMTDDMPDVLMTDVKMPQMDGLQLIEQALLLNPLLQCVVLSGYDEFAFAQRAIRMGVREYLLKPCSREEIAETLARVKGLVAREKGQLSSYDGLRAGRVDQLAQRLVQLRPGTDGVITPAQVEQAADTASAREFLRDAYVQCIAHSQRSSSAPGWSFSEIQQAYASDGELAAQVAEGLTRLAAEPQGRKAFVAQICAYIHAHYEDPGLSLQYLANHVVHMNPDYVGKEFAQAMGMRISAYLTQVRMERAKELILQPQERHIYEIAKAVGFGENPQYFSNVFHKYTGIPPKKFRKDAQAAQNP